VCLMSILGSPRGAKRRDKIDRFVSGIIKKHASQIHHLVLVIQNLEIFEIHLFFRFVSLYYNRLNNWEPF
jgi:hypothetical protein